MNISLLILSLCILSLIGFSAEAAPLGALRKYLLSFLKWTRASPKTHQADGNHLQFENGYLVETVLEQGNNLGIEPYSIRVSQDGELFAVDAINNNIVRITPPLSQYSRARLVAGSFQGYFGHVDGKPSDAQFNHPKGVAIDDKGNVYVADTSNFAIRKIGESGVTTIAGGKSNVAGYRDGPSEHAKFSSDFDIMYVPRTCSLLVVDRGNAALRQISLQQEDCDDQYGSISTSDIFMVAGAVFMGFAFCLLQQGLGSSFFAKKKQVPETEFQDQSIEKSIPVVETIKEEPVAGWPSFGRLISDLSKLAMETVIDSFLSFIPITIARQRPKKSLTSLKDSLVLPEDKAESLLVQKQRSPSPLIETLHAPSIPHSHTPQKPLKSKHLLKDPSLSGKHRSSKRQDFSELYGSSEAHQYGQFISKSQKDRSRHRHRDKSAEVVFGSTGVDPKSVEFKPVDYTDSKFNRYNIRSKFGAENQFHF